MVLIIGLTGGVGSGKTSVANLLKELGIEIIDTDQIAHDLTRPAGIAIGPIRTVFSSDFIREDGSLDRPAMHELVFSDKAARHKLEAILHPLIYQEAERRIPFIQSRYAVLVVPLLLETVDYLKLVDRVVVVDCPEPLQIMRTTLRSRLNDREVRAMMAAQCSRDERLARADDVIVNDLDWQHLRKQVQTLHQKYFALANESSN